MSARCRKSFSSIFPSGPKSFKVSSETSTMLARFTSDSCRKCLLDANNMSTLTCVGGRNLPRNTSTFFLYNSSDGCMTFPSGPNIAAFVSPPFTSFNAINLLSTCLKSGPFNRNISISIRRGVSPSSSDMSISSGSVRNKQEYRRLTPTIPNAYCCCSGSLSCIFTWMMQSFDSLLGVT